MSLPTAIAEGVINSLAEGVGIEELRVRFVMHLPTGFGAVAVIALQDEEREKGVQGSHHHKSLLQPTGSQRLSNRQGLSSPCLQVP